jgi:nucleoside-diphosphate-sugar epimerase
MSQPTLFDAQTLSSASLDRWTQFSQTQFSKTSASKSAVVDALITGANGFIGFNFAQRLLQAGLTVRLLARNLEPLRALQEQGADIQKLDLFDSAALARALAGVKTVYHLAAKTSAFSSDEMFRVNGEGTRNIAQACAEQKEKPVLVYVSSIAAAGPAHRGQIRHETDAPAPISIYGRSKFSGELALLEFANEVPTTIVRPGIVYGPWNKEMLPIFQTIQRLHLHPVVGWHTPSLSFSYVEDTLEIMQRAALHGTRLPSGRPTDRRRLHFGAGVYFAVGAEHPTYAELGRMIGGLLGRGNVKILPLLGPAPWIAAGANEIISRIRGQSEAFNLDKIREAQAESWACSPDYTAHDLDFQPAKPLRERLAETLQWYREHHWL